MTRTRKKTTENKKKGLAVLPVELRESVQHAWQSFEESALDEGAQIPRNPDFLAVLYKVWACSDFVSHSCIQYPQLLQDLIDSGDLLGDYTAGEYAEKLAGQLANIKNEHDLAVALRQFRRREMVRMAWRDLAGWAGLEETLRDLSRLADALVDGALTKLNAWLGKEWGAPKSADGEVQSLVVLGMGKLGALELNFSSDIDLIFAFPAEGVTRKRNGLENEEFFTRLGRKLINILNDGTADGFVYRVDMRLRPYGDSGPLAVSFAAMEDYYQSQGREWERYAMIKARVIAGDQKAGVQLLEILRPFVYRRYLDYGAFESLREMKGMISSQVARKGMQDNIKLGPGGIREIEFIGQAFQLIRGGREPGLRVRGILPVLNELVTKNYLPEYVANDLRNAYIFLRRVENRLQAFADEQVHTLPEDELDRKRLAFAMDYNDWHSFSIVLDRHRSQVQSHFEQVFAAPQVDSGEELSSEQADFKSIWLGQMPDDEALELLGQSGFSDPRQVLYLLETLRESNAYRARSSQGQVRMDQVMQLVLGAVNAVDNPDECLLRVINMLEAIAGRTAYLSLLVENPVALSQLVKLFAASPWIASLLISHPVLLDELLDPRSLYQLTHRDALHKDLVQTIERIDPDDLEQQMEALRYFKQSHVLHVAAADIAAKMPLMEVSDHLTEIAEEVLGEVLRIAQANLEKRHGKPVCTYKGKPMTPGFATIAYGKLGGIELGYGSDLDLVFLHDSHGEQQQTSGPKPIDNGMYFARLGQRIIHILDAHTPSGVLYEVDMRLRPSGASGLLVSGLDAFADYQREEAWTWEHQALVRARPVAGDPEIAAQFAEIRKEILSIKRDTDKLRDDVVEMREKMRTELDSSTSSQFDLKQGRGGIADIEFLVQYGVLRWAHKYPDLLVYTDNIRILKALSRNRIMTTDEALLLSDAYRAYRSSIHHRTLNETSKVVEVSEFPVYRKQVCDIWRKFMG